MIRRNVNLSGTASNWDLYAQDPELFITFAIELREDIMHSRNPENLDPQEKAIHGYGLNNFAWSDIWRSARKRVEDAMLGLQVSSQIDRGMALHNHQAFLTREQGSSPFPFYEQAIAFKSVMEKFYEQNSARALDVISDENKG